MYLSFSVENAVTIGAMLLLWMVTLHVLGQFGVHIAAWLPGGGA